MSLSTSLVGRVAAGELVGGEDVLGRLSSQDRSAGRARPGRGVRVIAVVCMTVAIVGWSPVVRGPAGWLIGSAAVLCFVTAVVLNVAAH